MNLRALRAPAVVVAASLALGAGACTDTTTQPKSTVTGAIIFNDQTAYKSFIARVYAGLTVTGQSGYADAPDIQQFDVGSTQYLRLYWNLQELTSDEMLNGWGNDRGIEELNKDQWTSGSQFVKAMYYRIYVQTMMANEFLRQTTPAMLASRGQTIASPYLAPMPQWRAEARFLRALSYWHAMDLFGSVPLVTENDPIGATPPKQATRDSIYKYVVSELLAIRDSLPSKSASNYGRATKDAANMLLANVYLNSQVYTGTPHWTEAMNAAAAVINSGNYTLDPVYRHVFGPNNNTSPEMIFAAVHDGVNTGSYGGTNFIIHAGCGGDMSAAAYNVNYCWGGNRLKKEAATTFYSPGDTRDDFFFYNGQTVENTAWDNFRNGIAAPKFTNAATIPGERPGSNVDMVDTDYPFFRLAEAYMIYAEAAVRTGTNLSQALTYVNLIRERAYGGTSGDITAAQLTLPFILAERGREFLQEGKRRTDLIRFGVFTGPNQMIWAWKGGVLAGQPIDAKYNLFPLPAPELVTNPNLTQNPGF